MHWWWCKLWKNQRGDSVWTGRPHQDAAAKSNDKLNALINADANPNANANANPNPNANGLPDAQSRK